jgi:hypothetical protein
MTHSTLRLAALFSVASLTLACTLAPPPPPPGKGKEGKEGKQEPRPSPGASPKPSAKPSPQPSPSRTAPRTQRPKLLAATQEAGLFLTDPWTGFTATTPGMARLEPAGGKGAHAYEAELRLSHPEGWAVRLRRDTAPPGSTALQRARTLVYARARAKPVEVAAFRPGELKRWRVDSAVAATYPLGKGEMWERAIVLVKGPRALVMWERAPASFGKALVTELSSRFYATFAWGGDPRRPSPVSSAYVDGSMRLRPAGETRSQQLSSLPTVDLERAAALLGAVAYSSADPPDERIDGTARKLIEERAGQLPEAVARALRGELKRAVRTYRDLRGLQLVLERAVELSQ